ncbi:hypothetical protein JTB14_037007 [Gonioctena quinquepunctata]|nr:hypothetical protein JTB14_037007 [Gonioctena quinquepunctata]
MDTFFNIILIFAGLRHVFAENDVVATASTISSPKPQPIYTVPEQSPISYIPPSTFSFFDGYGGYEGYYGQAPAKQPVYQEQPAGYLSSLIPATQNAIRFSLRALAKFGMFLIGGAALLLVGGIFTTALCSITPICIITFPGFSGLDKESMRSLMTPDKISAAAAMVQDAIGKYQRLQRAVGSKMISKIQSALNRKLSIPLF